MLKSNIPTTKQEEVILSMCVRAGQSTAFRAFLTGQQIDELETLIEKLLRECGVEMEE